MRGDMTGSLNFIGYSTVQFDRSDYEQLTTPYKRSIKLSQGGA